jgi:hypothetical protein
MQNAAPLKKRKTRPSGWRISLFTQAAFIVSLFFTCLCGHFCEASILHGPDSGPATVESGGCCSTCPIENNAEPADPGCECCVLKQSDFVYELTTDEIPSCRATHVERIIEWLCPRAPGEPYPQLIFHSTIPLGLPPYLRFETLLI